MGGTRLTSSAALAFPIALLNGDILCNRPAQVRSRTRGADWSYLSLLSFRLLLFSFAAEQHYWWFESFSLTLLLASCFPLVHVHSLDRFW
jgi:hypothetical protein